MIVHSQPVGIVVTQRHGVCQWASPLPVARCRWRRPIAPSPHRPAPRPIWPAKSLMQHSSTFYRYYCCYFWHVPSDVPRLDDEINQIGEMRWIMSIRFSQQTMWRWPHFGNWYLAWKILEKLVGNIPQHCQLRYLPAVIWFFNFINMIFGLKPIEIESRRRCSTPISTNSNPVSVLWENLWINSRRLSLVLSINGNFCRLYI